jgi:hypothetical protein
MAIERIREACPTELPEANLFLDDIKAIHELFVDEIRKVAQDSESVSTKYVVRKITRCDSLDDLEELGGSVRQFQMNVEVKKQYGLGRTTLSIDSYSLLNTLGLSNEAEWALHARVASLCDERGVRLYNTFNSLPINVQGMLWGLASLCSGVAFTTTFVMGSYLFRHVAHRSYGLLCAIAMPCWLFAGLISLAQRKGRVKLYYRHSIERERRAHGRALLMDVVKIVIGAILGVLGTLFLAHITHKA